MGFKMHMTDVNGSEIHRKTEMYLGLLDEGRKDIVMNRWFKKECREERKGRLKM